MAITYIEGLQPLSVTSSNIHICANLRYLASEMGDSTMTNLIASFFIIVSLLYLVLYGFTLLAIARSKDLMELPCYRIMIALGLFDIIQVVLIGLVPGCMLLVDLIGDAVNKVLGAILMFGWYGATTLALILSINRLVTVYTGSNADNVFSGKKVFIWIGLGVAYALAQLVVYNCPITGLVFSPDTYSWNYINETAYTSNDIRMMEVVSDSSMFLAIIVCYICLGVLLRLKRSSSSSKKLTKNDTRALVSAFVVAGNCVALDLYFNIANSVNPLFTLWVTVLQQFFWLVSVGKYS